MAKTSKKAPARGPMQDSSSHAYGERAEIAVLNAEYGQGKGWMYKHLDGPNLYEFVEAGATKCRIDGIWYVAVFYRGQDKMLRSTTAERWRQRFERASK